MCSCDGLGPEQPSLESGLYVPRVTDWNLKMTPKKTNLMKSIKKLKKPVFWIFLAEGTCGVAQRAKELSDYWFETNLQADSNFCRIDQICPEFLKEILKTLTQKVLMDKEETAAPIPEGGKRGRE